MNTNETVITPAWLGILTLILGVLQVTGVANIGWLWVLAPIWIPYGIVTVLLAVYYAATLVWGLSRRKRKVQQHRVNEPHFNAKATQGAITSALSSR